jgi:hypothetical protein
MNQGGLTNNIFLLKKEDTFNHMGECIKTGCLGCELLEMIRWGEALLGTLI